MTRPTTIEDVARAAGVSVATVSRAIRDLPNVAPATRHHVRQVAADLRYRPDPRASALAAGRTNTVAMAVPLLDSWYFSRVMAGAEAVLSDAGYDLLLFAVDDDARLERLLSGALLKRADGLILVDLRVAAKETKGLLGGKLCVVAIGIEVEGASSVMVDDFEIARQAVSHLVQLGHTRIGLLEGFADDPLNFGVPMERRRGYETAMNDADLPVRDDHLVAGNFSVEGGREAMAGLLALDQPPTAVFAMSDEMAFGALREISDAGLSVPGDISVVGVDDHDFADMVGLTTIHQEVHAHGAIAARMLLDLLMDPAASPRHHIAATALIERRTTGPSPE